VFTKTDKLSKTAVESNIAKYKRELLKQWEELPPIFITSSETGVGRDELLTYFEELNKLPVQTESGDHDE
jgi:GTP-binding protein